MLHLPNHTPLTENMMSDELKAQLAIAWIKACSLHEHSYVRSESDSLCGHYTMHLYDAITACCPDPALARLVQLMSGWSNDLFDWAEIYAGLKLVTKENGDWEVVEVEKGEEAFNARRPDRYADVEIG
jgi:hypothetical protein